MWVVDLGASTAGELVAALRARRLSSRELVVDYLERIDRLNPAVNAVVSLDAEVALQAADRADAAWRRGEWLGPLHGLPITIEDALDTAGLVTTGGAHEFAERVPLEDAGVVARYRSAGAVVLGKTNLPRWSFDAQTWNELHGATGNPWDLERTPGGSSGGSAAAVAAGLCAFDTGTDISGSIRIPASFTGVFGHKPTYGFVPQIGYFDRPGGGTVDVDINCVGPIGRSVDDLELALSVASGVAPGQRRFPIETGRIAIWIDDGPGVDREVRAVILTAVDGWRDAGISVDTFSPPFDRTQAEWVFHFLFAAALPSSFPELAAAGRSLRGSAPNIADPYDGFRRGLVAEPGEWRSVDEQRAVMKRAWARTFAGGVDAVVCPVVPVVAPFTEPGVDISDRSIVVSGADTPAPTVVTWCQLVGLVGLPSTVIPVGFTAGGLPVGVQVVAPAHCDFDGLAVARTLDAVIDAHRVPALEL